MLHSLVYSSISKPILVYLITIPITSNESSLILFLFFKIVWRNINNLRYADDNTLTAESEELKGLLMKVKESEKVGLKLNIQKMKIMASGPITYGK